jgi:hypothetical protein
LYVYAENNKENIVCSVSDLSNEVVKNTLISIPQFTTDILCAFYIDNKFCKYSKTETELSIVYQWGKYDFEECTFIVDIENNTSILIDGIEYTPIDGRVEINL